MPAAPTVQMGLIQGRTPKSHNEWFTWLALNSLGHKAIYQYAVYGNRGVKGEAYIDFLVVTTVPLPTPLEVNGVYWHSGQLGARDRLRNININNEHRGQWLPIKYIWGPESETEELARATLLQKIGHA
jgi:hypothetical protein